MKILIIGIVASGKTTIAKKLEQQLNIREAQLNKYSSKLIKISNEKDWEEYFKNEYSKT